ncbi:DUF1396 domain-containing protein [Streptomyces sp. NPDC003717]|uniref:DUF1396 domain-containing protein n=1 Tax=Streptomyces sp. NPDC003717 TaxID=3154276 RepID=UPI0033B100F0
MKTKLRVPVSAGLTVLVLAAGAVGCAKGDDESPELSPAAAVAKAAKNTEDITSLSYRMKGQFPGQGSITAEAQMQLKPEMAMSMKMSMPKLAQGSYDARLVGKAMYLGGGQEMAKELDGKHWIKFDLSALGAGDLEKQLGGSASQVDKNPAAESTFLTGADDLEKVGTEKVDGVETTHYKGTVTLDQLRESLAKAKGNAATRKTQEKGLEQYEKMGIKTLKMDGWIDGDEHTKQFRMRGDSTQGPMDVTITFVDINKPVKVTAPAAADTADLAEMMKEAQQG